MKVLTTGASGFLGGYLMRTFRAAGRGTASRRSAGRRKPGQSDLGGCDVLASAEAVPTPDARTAEYLSVPENRRPKVRANGRQRPAAVAIEPRGRNLYHDGRTSLHTAREHRP